MGGRKKCRRCGRRLRYRRLRGGGIFDSLTGAVSGAWTAAKDYLRPLDDSYTRGTAQTLTKYGGQEIVRVVVFRKPVAAAIAGLLNWLSLGALEKAQRKYGYEKFYHLGTHVTLADGTGLLVEKLEVVNVAVGALPAGDGAEYRDAAVPAGLNLYDYVENTRRAMGDGEFFNYRALPIDGKPANNCQVFVRALLAANGALTPELEAFVMQPMEELAKEIPGYVKDTAQWITDFAGTARKLTGMGGRRRHVGSGRRGHWKRRYRGRGVGGDIWRFIKGLWGPGNETTERAQKEAAVREWKRQRDEWATHTGGPAHAPGEGGLGALASTAGRSALGWFSR